MKQWRSRFMAAMALVALFTSLLPSLAATCSASGRTGEGPGVCRCIASMAATDQSQSQNAPAAMPASKPAATPGAVCAMPDCCRILPAPAGDHQPPASAALVFSQAAAKGLLSAFAGLELAGAGSHALLPAHFVIAPPTGFWRERAAYSASPLSSSHSPPSPGRSPPVV